jgi:hypothetical protein
MVGNKARHKPRYVAQRRAEALRPIFDELATMSDKEVAEKLNQRGIEAPGAKWYATMVRRVRDRLTAPRSGSTRF